MLIDNLFITDADRTGVDDAAASKRPDSSAAATTKGLMLEPGSR